MKRVNTLRCCQRSLPTKMDDQMKKDNDPANSQMQSRRFFCKVPGCPKQHIGYTRKRNLDDHTRSHHTSERFLCSQCDRPFTRLGDLITHTKRVHLGEKPFACLPDLDSSHGCNRVFASKHSLNRHRQPFKDCKVPGPTLAQPMEDRPARDLEHDSLLRENFMATVAMRLSEQQASYPELVQNFPNVNQMTILGETSFSNAFTSPTEPCGNDLLNSIYVRLMNVFRRWRSGSCRQLLAAMLPALMDLLTSQLSDKRELGAAFQTLLHDKAFLHDSLNAHTELWDMRDISSPEGSDTPSPPDPGDFMLPPPASNQRPNHRSEQPVPILSALWNHVDFTEEERDSMRDVARNETMNVVEQAFVASQYCKSIASGHTNSTLESVLALRQKASLPDSDGSTQGGMANTQRVRMIHNLSQHLA